MHLYVCGLWRSFLHIHIHPCTTVTFWFSVGVNVDCSTQWSSHKCNVCVCVWCAVRTANVVHYTCVCDCAQGARSTTFCTHHNNSIAYFIMHFCAHRERAQIGGMCFASVVIAVRTWHRRIGLLTLYVVLESRTTRACYGCILHPENWFRRSCGRRAHHEPTPGRCSCTQHSTFDRLCCVLLALRTNGAC